MRLSTLRKIDYWVGVPLCFLLDIVALIFSLLVPRSKDIQNVLFIELSEAGSMIIGYSAMKRLKEALPKSNLYFLTFKRHADGLKIINMIDEDNIITMRDDNLLNFLTDTLKAVWKMRRLKIDTVIDMELYSRATGILSLISLAANRVGFYGYTGEGLYRGRFIHNYKVGYNAYKHMSLNFMALVESVLNDETNSPLLKRNLPEGMVTPLKLEPTDADRKNAVSLIESKYPDYWQDKKIVLMNPNAGELPIRAWEIGRFAETAKRILESDEKTLVVLIGLPSAARDGAYIKGQVANDRLVNLIGATKSLKDVVDLCQISRILLTNDSGPAQYASLTNTNVIVFFGPETPDLYKPLGHKVFPLYSGFSCSPCLTAANHRNSVCTDNKCLQAISVEEVTRLCLDLL